MKPKRFFFHQTRIFGQPLRYGAPLFAGFIVFVSGLDAEAGDILRGGGAQRGKGSAKKASQIDAPTPADADAARANARDMLARTDRTLAAMRAMQNAARANANKGPNNLGKNPLRPTLTLPNVPDGLATGGLKVSGNVTTDPSKWQGAKLPTQTVSNGKTKVTVKQTEQQALLEWETFNIGKNTTLNFDQSKGGENAGQWIAFNKVSDPSANPTQILGNLSADGQVYILNSNGILFGGSSQVNTRGLTASALPINDNLVQRGLLNNPDAQFLFSGLDIPTGINGTPAFTPEKPQSADGKYGDVIVQKGAVIKNPTDASKTGGRITLVGANVTNEGTISTPDGQTILAAGLQVGFEAHSSSDASLRGLDVYVGAVSDTKAGAYAGSVHQLGLIESKRGSITIDGKEVVMDGILHSSTSVSLNGRIDIQANYNAVSNRATANASGALYLFKDSGSISFGEDSLIRILPEYDSKESAIGTQLALRSIINLSGKTIHLGSDSSIFAPNAEVSMRAGTWYYDTSSASPTSTLIRKGGQLYFDSGSTIDVSGSEAVPVPVSQNIVEVDLRGAELADSPLQRDGKLRNQTIFVDIRDVGTYSGKLWTGTPLANVSGFANLIQRGVGQLTVAGGSVNLSAGSSVVVRGGAVIDVSGGSTAFEAGMVRTTQLMTSDGRLVDISQATPDINYKGIFDGSFTVNNAKFGVSKIFHSMLAPAGYRYEGSSVQGAAGGKLTITAPSMALDGELRGRTITGEKQRTSPPAASTLSLTFTGTDTTYPAPVIYAPSPPDIIFAKDSTQSPVSDFELNASGDAADLSDERKSTLLLSQDLMTSQGFGNLEISNRGGEVVVPKGVTLESPTGGKISISASNITVDGTVAARAGSVSLTTNGLTYDQVNLIQNSPPLSAPPVIAAGQGIFKLGKDGRIDVSGVVADDRESHGGPTVSPLLLNGGSVSLLGYSIDLVRGGEIDVSGGAVISGRGAVTYGNGGTLAISAGREPGYSSSIGGELTLNSRLSGYSGGKAGSLRITGQALQIGGTINDSRVTLIDPELFAERGFANLSFSGIGVPDSDIPAVLVHQEADLHPIVTGVAGEVDDLEPFTLRRVIRDETVRSPVQLTLAGLGASFAGVPFALGSVVTETGSTIRTDAGGSIEVKGQTVTIGGSLVSPGGKITISGDTAYPSVATSTSPRITVHLDSTAVLSAAGTRVLINDPFGRRTGTVSAGGSLSISGNIMAEKGSVLDVSGTSGILDLPATSKTLESSDPSSFSGTSYEPVRIETNGGTITLAGSQILLANSTFKANAGGSSASGGELVLSSNRFYQDGETFTSADINLVVSTKGPDLSMVGKGISVGDTIVDSSGIALTGQGYFATSSIESSGIGSLTLGGNVRFEGKVSIDLPEHLTIGSGGVIEASNSVRLNAGHIVLGQPFRTPTLSEPPQRFTSGTAGSNNSNPYFLKPEYGSGNLRISAGLVDIGDVALQGFEKAIIQAADGDVRGNGTLQMAGDLRIHAGQVYATTQRAFNLFVYDHAIGTTNHQGSITFLGGTTRPLPYSAGGTLSVYASEITQNGTLRAPLGQINLGWNGTGSSPFNVIAGTGNAAPVASNLTLGSESITSVSLIDPITKTSVILPYGISLDGKSWIDPAGNNIATGGLPSKQINLSATSVVTARDSTVDIRGGGDLFAYRWVAGNGGTTDILANEGSFAIVPDYAFNYSPFAPFNSDSSATNLDGSAGYANSNLKAGDQITIAGSGNLAAGTYTLLPARYALLNGAFLITPSSGASVSGSETPEGTSIVSGYIANNLNPARQGSTVITRFEVAPSEVVNSRAQYDLFSANGFLKNAAVKNEIAIPRLPVDSGYLSFTSTSRMSLLGGVLSASPDGGRGSLIDINSSSDILINQSGKGGTASQLVLKNSQLNEFGAESLLIGGIRSFSSKGVSVEANTSNLTLDNEGGSLKVDDIILVSDGELTLSEGSRLESGRKDGQVFDTLLFGTPETAGSGDGTLVRVSANESGGINRFGTGSSATPLFRIASNASLSGSSIILDSTARAKLAVSASLRAEQLSIGAGNISILLNKPGVSPSSGGLVFSGKALATVQESTRRLSLTSYTSLDTYGTGTIGSSRFERLSIHAGAIQGYGAAAGTVNIRAGTVEISNSFDSSASTAPGTTGGRLAITADEIILGSNATRLDGFTKSELTAAGKIVTSGEGSLLSDGDLDLNASALTGNSASDYAIISNRLLSLGSPSGSASASSGFGARLRLQGRDVTLNGDVLLASGRLDVTATSGDVFVGNSNIDLSGNKVTMIDAIRYTGGGNAWFTANQGSVTLGTKSVVNVSAPDGGGNAGAIGISTPNGSFEAFGRIMGSAGDEENTASFSLDAATISNANLASLDSSLNKGDFTKSRIYRIRTGDVSINSDVRSRYYGLSADNGNLTVNGKIDASGDTGGTISLTARGSLIVSDGSRLDASAENFSSAGKGGLIELEAGAHNQGTVSDTAVLDLKSGSTIDLSVAAMDTSSASRGQFAGTLHLRAPRNAANSDLQVESIGSEIVGASSILVEGVKHYLVNGTITTALQNTIRTNGNSFLGTAGTASASYTAMLGRLTAQQPDLDLILAPGVELYNPAGDIVLGSTASTSTSDWNLQTFRFGPKSAPGILTIRASGDIVFYNALSDGFAAVTPNANNGQSSLWLAPLMKANELLPANTQSWSYRFTSGADLSSADFRSVLPEDSLSPDKGSFLLGKNYGNAASFGSGSTHTTARSITNRYQVVRTGSGDITINSGRNVHLLNQFASIYSAGTLVSDPTTVINPNDFVVPLLLSAAGRHPGQGPALGAIQQSYFVQYSMAGGNISIHAAKDIARMTRNVNSATGGNLIDDSSRQLPNHWLYRRGYIDPVTGNSGIAGVEDGTISLVDPDASTTWWVDFSNFFEGVGALGGGNVTINAGNDVKNVDALAPTNSRMAGGTPSPSRMVELGGGDVTIVAGHNIDGGVYYVERGEGFLNAGNEITTNATRSPSRGIIESLTNPSILDSKTWLPTTFVVGKGGFEIQASGDLLLGPTVNTFLLPQGLNNKYWYKTYFSSYSQDSYLDATSLGGSITLRTAASLPSEPSQQNILSLWSTSQYYLPTPNSPAGFQPWLRLAETETSAFQALSGIGTPRLKAYALAGGINLVGGITTFPSKNGQLELVASHSITGLQPTGIISSANTDHWSTATVNLSDTDPKNLPSISNPYAYFSVVGNPASAQRLTGALNAAGFLDNIDSRFIETGSSNGVLQDEQKLHTNGLLHRSDPDPLRIYAEGGNIEGITLFSPKASRIIAGTDIGDVSLYLQNSSATDVSVVSAGRDLTPYNENTSSRFASQPSFLLGAELVSDPLAGDIQIAGPGNLEVFAGRNLDLGIGSSRSDGTGTGISSIGNGRNPFLSFGGADITVAAGIGAATSLDGSHLNFDKFIKDYVDTERGHKYLKSIAPDANFDKLSEDEQNRLALEIFFLTLRDAGRSFNDPDSAGYQDSKYPSGFGAIQSLFSKKAFDWSGDILTQSRDIRTRSGGDIRIMAPGGGLEMADTTIGNPLTPPGIVTESGGHISLFAKQSVTIGIGRIFTLKGGNVVIWSSKGDIAAGSSSRTVSAAPPTRVVIDPQSAAVATDLAGLATGGGIGVLATVEGVKPGDVDLIAPAGVIDAGDAGIRVSGNINLAAVTVVNAGNISAGGTSTGAPSTTVSAPSISTVTSASNTSAAAGSTEVRPNADQAQRETQTTNEEASSIYTIEVIGYGGGSAPEDEEEDEESSNGTDPATPP